MNSRSTRNTGSGTSGSTPTRTSSSSVTTTSFVPSFGLRTQIKIVQAVCSNKLILKRMLRNLGGEDALILYRTVKDFFRALMGYTGKETKIIQGLIQVFGEIFVKFTHRIVAVEDWAQWGQQMEAVMEELCAYIDKNHTGLGIQLNLGSTPAQRGLEIGNAAANAPEVDPDLLEFRYTYLQPPKPEALVQLKRKLSETIQRAREVTLATIGSNLSDNSAVKLQKIADKLCAEGPLKEMCAFNSDATDYAKMAFSVMERMREKEARRQELTGSLERIIRVPRI